MALAAVDGTYELFRAFYGAPSRKSSGGQEIGATRSLVRSLAALSRNPRVSHIAVAFDHVIESFRNELFAGYKTGEGIEPDLRSQFELAEDAVAALGITVWPMVEFEADDALCTAAKKFRGDLEVLLCSPDKDLYQCVGEGVLLWDRLRDKFYDSAAVEEKLGVAPESIPDYLALVGDSADGIPGIPKWGAKSTATVLSHYRFIENIPDDVAQWEVNPRGAKGLAANLASQRKDALLYKKLATLRDDVPLGCELADLVAPTPLQATSVLVEMAQSLELDVSALVSES